MSRLIFLDPGHLQAAREFAERTGQAANLEAIFTRLEEWAENEDAKIFLSPDFVPHSWYFQKYPERFNSIPDDWQKHRIMNGGVIYHGPLEDGSRPETFAVTLTETNSWSIHT